MSGDTLNNNSVQNGLASEKNSFETEHITSINVSKTNTLDTQEKTTTSVTDSKENPALAEFSSENSKEATLKRSLSGLENFETQGETNLVKTQAKKQKGDPPESSSQLSPQKETTSQKSSSPAPVRFGFGSTLSDPKYAWLNSFGKATTETKKDDNISKADKKPTNLFGSFQTSGSSLSEITPSKTNGFDALLEKASDTIVPVEKKSPALSLQDTLTGEENEITAFETKGRLHVLGEGNKWVERGVGVMKINYKKDDESDRRLIMRLEAVHKVILNVKISSKLKPNDDGKFVRFSAFEKVDSPNFFLFRAISTTAASQMVSEMLKASE